MKEHKAEELALLAGEAMLSSGGETFRVEDTMERILASCGITEKEVTTLNTFITVSVKYPQGHWSTLTRKVMIRSVNFSRISQINQVSRMLAEKKITPTEAYNLLLRIKNSPSRPTHYVALGYGIAAGAFTMAFLGNFYDGISAFIAGNFLGFFQSFLDKKRLPYALNSLFGSVTAAIIALFFYHFGLGSHYDVVIAGAMMPLLPGVLMTNAIRDIMEGNLISGTSKIVEAVLIAVAVASGAGFVLAQYLNYFS